jgi:hypothetical protein
MLTSRHGDSRYRSWKVTWVFPFANAVFLGAFIARCFGAWDNGDVPSFITQYILMYLMPPFLQLANFHVFSRVLYYVPYFSPIHPGRLLSVFSLLLVVIEIVTAVGVGLIASPDGKLASYRLGGQLTRASLAMQAVVILTFFVLMATFQLQCRRGRPFFSPASQKIAEGRVSIAAKVWLPLLTLYSSTGLITVRTCYRILEHFVATDVYSNVLFRIEWCFYAFDAALMLINMLLWNLMHPGRFLPPTYRIYLAKDGVTEVVGKGWTDSRPWIIAACDPCGFFDKEKQEKPFWEVDSQAGDSERELVSFRDDSSGRTVTTRGS